jgi:hypothetical protein
VSVFLGYFLGARQQKKQASREHIIERTEEMYPALFSEIKRNLELLDNYLEEPNINFNFLELDQIYDHGLDGFIADHHKDLFLKVDYFKKEIVPKFSELSALFGDFYNKIFIVWSEHLRNFLPKEFVGESRDIADYLSRTINPYYVIPDLLNERHGKIRAKIESCILNKTAHIYKNKAANPFIISRQPEVIDYDELSQSLIEKAKPKSSKVVSAYEKLKKQVDEEVKLKLFPLLRKYISNPI